MCISIESSFLKIEGEDKQTNKGTLKFNKILWNISSILLTTIIVPYACKLLKHASYLTWRLKNTIRFTQHIFCNPNINMEIRAKNVYFFLLANIILISITYLFMYCSEYLIRYSIVILSIANLNRDYIMQFWLCSIYLDNLISPGYSISKNIQKL